MVCFCTVQHFALRRLANQLLHRRLEHGGRLRDDLALRCRRKGDAYTFLQVRQAIPGKPAAIAQQRDHAGRGCVVLLFAYASGSFRGEHFATEIAAQLLKLVDGGSQRSLAAHAYQPSGLMQRIDFSALTFRAAIPALQRAMRHFDALGACVRHRAVAPVAGSGLLRTGVCCRCPRSRAGCHAGLFQNRLRLLAARTAQQPAQTDQRCFPVLQQLGHITQRANRRFQLLISPLAQGFPHALQQGFQLFGADLQRSSDRQHLRLLQQLAKTRRQRIAQHLFERAIRLVGLIVFASPRRRSQQNPVGSAVTGAVYLHYLFDLWADVWRKKVAKGDVIVVRYADDLVVGFQHRTEAERFLKEFRERLAKFGLELHSDKTRLIEFGRFAARDRKARGEGKPETFTFLGFTHYCGQRHKSGTFTVWRITAKKRMVAKLKAIKVELQRRMHDRMAEVGAWLRKVVLGYYQYHAVPGNTTQLRIFKLRVCRLWQSVLVRRSQRAQMRWERLTPVLNRWIPPPRVLHPYPDARFYATHPS
jgi:Reverse transcriptase (RNA-dependent DNA polymerase)